MPSNTVEGLEIQFGNLGIGFGESTGESPSSRLETEESTPVIKEVGRCKRFYSAIPIYMLMLF